MRAQCCTCRWAYRRASVEEGTMLKKIAEFLTLRWLWDRR